MHANIANVRLLQERFADAIAEYRTALDLSPTPVAYDNLAMALLMSGDPASAIDAVDACLERASYDTRALAYKALALRELDREDDAQEILGLDRYIHAERLDGFEGFHGLSHFHDVLIQELLSHPSLTWEPPSRTTRQGSQTGQLMRNPAIAVTAFERTIRAAIDRYIGHLRDDPPHPFSAHPPRDYTLNIWGTVLADGGHQDPHIHANAWLSGVYYAQLPPGVGGGDDAQDGWIEFGCNDHELPIQKTPRVRRLEPELGLVVLFPSFLYHRTIPFRGDQKRISVAFDLIRTA